MRKSKAANLTELNRHAFVLRARCSLKPMLVGALLTYLGVLLWFTANWFLAIAIGVPGLIVLIVGIDIGATKSPLQKAIEAIDDALREDQPKGHVQTVRETIQELRMANESVEERKMQEAILIWTPLYDNAI